MRIGGTASNPGDALECPTDDCEEVAVQTGATAPDCPKHGEKMVPIG
jgi:hypothetical protein